MKMKYKIYFLSLLMCGLLTPSLKAQEEAQEEAAAPAEPAAAAPKKHKKPARKVKKARKAKKKTKKQEQTSSKYKVVIDAEPSTYRFDSAGNPIRTPRDGGEKRKKKQAMSSEAVSTETQEDASCSGDACKAE